MKNSTLFPFERNKYFYGKLLSVDDFELEQKYFNDKRRAVNHFLGGVGVVAGMHVVMVDEQTVSVETGFALDNYGREVVIDAPVLKKLSLLDGFGDCVDSGESSCYLCVEYAERETTPVHNIVGGLSAEGGQSDGNNRIREGFRLHLTSREPEELNLSVASLFEEKIRIYSADGVTIDQTLSRYAQHGDETELRIEIENLGQQYISFSYDCELTCLSYNGESKLNISFDEMLFEKTGKYTLRYQLRTADVVGVEGIVAPEAAAFRFFSSKQPVEGAALTAGRSAIQLTAHSIIDEVIDGYYRSAMEWMTKSSYRENIYLARIHMVRAGDTYIIERMENTPFGQQVMNLPLNTALTRMLIEEVAKSHSSGGDAAAGYLGGAGGKSGPKVASGVYTLDLSSGGLRNQRFFTSEIFHGIGLGNVSITIGIQEQAHETYFGSGDVFQQQSIHYESAVCLYEEKGSFIVGIRLTDNITSGKLTIRWTALRASEEEREDMVEKKIFIKPGILDLGTREGYYLEANCVNMTDKRVNWIVAKNAGSIDGNGYYTAPNLPGVYEVVAQSAVWPEVKATLFVVVREKE